MPISGLMLTLSADAHANEIAMREICGVGGIEVGVRQGRRVATVLETRSQDENRRLWGWLNDLPGVSHVDVLFVSLDDDAQEPPRPLEAQREEVAPRCP